MGQAIKNPVLRGLTAAGTFGMSEAGGILPILDALQPDITPPSATPPPTTETKAVQQAVADAAKRRSRARGLRSTILSKDFLDEKAPALQTTLGS